MKRFEIQMNILKIILDYFLILLGFLVAYYLRKNGFYAYLYPVSDYSLFKELADFLIWAAKLSGVYVFMLFLANAYRFEKVSLSDDCYALFKGSLFWFGFVITFYFLNRVFPFSRFIIVFNFFLSFGFLCLGRYLISIARSLLNGRGYGLKNLLIVNYGQNSLQDIVKESQQIGEFNIVAIFAENSDKNICDQDCSFVQIDDLSSKLQDFEFDELLQIGSSIDVSTNEMLLDYCRYNQKIYSYVPEVFDIQRSNIAVRQIGDFYVYRLENTRLNRWGRVWKRVFDLLVALIALIILSPLIILIAILIKLDDPKSTVMWRYLDDGLTVAKRVGLHKNLFYCYKFRTMKPSSHNQRYNELADKDIRKDELVKISNDPRVTKIGKILRRFDLDELPQLFNVIIGNMSLVGPRPHLPEEVARYKYHHQFVFNIKPGITGLAQVSGRSDLSFENEVKLDSYYIENWSLWLDMKILLKTVLVVFESHGEQKK